MKRNKLFYLALASLFCVSCFFSKKDKDSAHLLCFRNYALLHEKELDFVELDLDTANYSEALKYSHPTDNSYLITKDRIWLLNKKYNITHRSSNRMEYFVELEGMVDNDSIGIYKQKFSIDDLHAKSYWQDPDFGPYMHVYIYKIFELQFHEKKYLLIQAVPRNINGTFVIHFCLLFDITDPENVVPIPIGFQINAERCSYFGDFNKDKKLDLLDWNMSDSIVVYSLDQNNTLQLIKDNYLIVNYITPEHERIFASTWYINKNKSKWFFELRAVNQSQDSCQWEFNTWSPFNAYTSYSGWPFVVPDSLSQEK